MRFAPWPRSMRARLLLVMVGGLLLALFASSAIFWWDRGHFERRMRVDHYVEHVAAAVRLLESGGTERRADILRVMRTPLFQAEEFPGVPAAGEIQEGETPLSREVQSLLRERLGRDEILVRVAPMRGRGQWPPPRGVVDRHLHRSPSAFVAVVGLADDSAVRFAYRLPGGGRWPSRLLASTGFLLLAVVVIAVIAVRFVVRPLRRVADQAERIGRDLDAPAVPETGPTEVRRVMVAMNTMQSKIRELFDQRSRFLAAVSHDLRTPVTRMRLRAELIEDDTLRERMDRDLAEMERMVQETLEFVRDGDRREESRKVDVNAMIEALVEDAAEQGGSVSFAPMGRPVILTRPLALKRCLSNLVSNAMRHGEHVELSVSFDGESLVIEVRDDGPGIAEAELERVFEPYYRGDAARGDGGTGLGLSIARAIAGSLGGDLVLENRPSGGLIARLRLHGTVA